LDLSSNQAYPGPGAFPIQDNLEQEAATYDTVNGNIYVRGGDANDISVINASTFTNVANIPAPIDNQQTFYVPPVAVDNETGYLYSTNAGVSSNVSIISGVTETVTGSIPVGGSPHGIAFDWRNHDFYVADWGTSNITVFSADTNKTLTSISVGTDPLAVVYDTSANRVFVTNYGSGNVSVINPATNKVVRTLVVKTDPVAITIDTHDDLVDVLDAPGPHDNVSVFAAAGSSPIVTNVSAGPYAYSFAYDPHADRLFVAGGQGNLTAIQQPVETLLRTPISIGTGAADAATVYDPRNGNVIISGYQGGPDGSGNITVINATSIDAIANDSTDDGPYAVVVDPGTGDAYVMNGGTSSLEPNVTVLSEATGLSIASVPLAVYPTGITYDSAQKALYTVDSGGNDVYEVNAASDHVVGVDIGGPHPTSTSISAPVAYDGANGDIYTADGSVPAVEVFSATHTLIATINVGEWPDALAYDNVSKRLFVANNYNGNVSIINTTTNTLNKTSLSVKQFDSLDAIAYDAHSNEVYAADSGGNNITVWGAQNDTKLKTIEVGAYPDSIVVDPQNHTIFVANHNSGNVSVISDTTNKVVEAVSLTDPYILAYDSGTGTIYNAEDFENDIDAFNATTYVTLSGSPLYLGAGGGYYVEGIIYDPATGDLYVSDSTGDALITVGPLPSYPVEFYETGLRQGTFWSVTLNGTLETSFTPTIDFTEFAGTYAYSVGPVPGYFASPTYGGVTVPDSHQPINITFTSEFTPWSPVETLYSVYNDRADLQAAIPDAFTNFMNYTELVHWAAWVVEAGPTADGNYSTLAPFGYWYALMGTYTTRADLQTSIPDAFSNFTNYTHLVHWGAWMMAEGSTADSAYATLAPFGYWYVLMGTYSYRADLVTAFPEAYSNLTNFTELVHWAAWVTAAGSLADSAYVYLHPLGIGYWYVMMATYTDRADLLAAFPDAYSNFASYTALVSWAGAVVNGTYTDSANATLQPYGYYYALVGLVYEHRADLKSSYPSVLTNYASYTGLLGWAKEVVTGAITDKAKSTLLPYATEYETLA